jgi:hypothetical protein
MSRPEEVAHMANNPCNLMIEEATIFAENGLLTGELASTRRLEHPPRWARHSTVAAWHRFGSTYRGVHHKHSLPLHEGVT